MDWTEVLKIAAAAAGAWAAVKGELMYLKAKVERAEADIQTLFNLQKGASRHVHDH